MTLQFIWFVLLGILPTVYAVLDGFDLGVGVLHPFVARTDSERRTLLGAVGPVWDGNEVWLLTGGAALVAAFPQLYATVFSGFYLAMMLLVLGLTFRAVSIEFRSQVASESCHKVWDWAFCLGSLLPALLFGAVTIATALTLPGRFNNFMLFPVAWLVPLLTIVAIVSTFGFLRAGNGWRAFCSSAATIVGLMGIVAVSLFPHMLPATNDPANSLTAFNASSSQLTLQIMLIMVVISLPLVIAYTYYVYRMFKGKVRLIDDEY